MKLREMLEILSDIVKLEGEDVLDHEVLLQGVVFEGDPSRHEDELMEIAYAPVTGRVILKKNDV